MKREKGEVALISLGFSPNIGGIEPHFDDLIFVLTKRGWYVRVLTYQPLLLKERSRWVEKRKQVVIFRLPILRGFFYKLVNYPFLEFFYLFPGLFFALPLFLLVYPRVRVLHTHGLIAGTAGLIWGRIFGKRVIVTTHSIYQFPKKGFYRSFVKWLFNKCDGILTLSKQSKNEIASLGIPKNKITVFTYWVDQKIFKPMDKNLAKKELDWQNKFIVFFVGRLIEVKGVSELLEAARLWDKNITLVIAGTGPLEEEVRNLSLEIRSLKYLGRVSQADLPLYYSAADLVIVPSTHEEGFGRVILEALSCGTPVIGANRGAIPEAVDESVGKLIKVTPENIKKEVEYFYDNPKELRKLAKNARRYAEEKFSEENVETIIRAYTNG